MSNDRIGVIDYGGGNLQNVLNTLKFVGAEGQLVSAAADLDSVDRLIFPGVGAFGDCIEHIDKQGLREPIVKWLEEDRPFFGICLGYQILFEGSEECPDAKGLGFIKGQVVKFPTGTDLKVPHMGWNQVNPVDPSDPIWADCEDPLYLYFVHSFYPKPDDMKLASSLTNYGHDFASSITTGNVFAAQFHPERSQDAGIQLIRNFLK